ncbi:HK97 family phage prohead protease [Domibacillus tundrae]|uniref:HK97 family phage prohead protease n=1 Tax=Domibacillus tundrae TaxID=1587527 RepID=UPI0006180F3D|nr:HK97 family phage prohead protease [Domibacillus tundrae]
MTRYIYGRAMPLHDSYVEASTDITGEQYEVQLIPDRSVIQLDTIIGATVQHDYCEEIGRSDKGTLDIVVNDTGVYFRIHCMTDRARRTHARIRRGELKHCSLSFTYKSRQIIEKEQQAAQLTRALGWEHATVKVNEYTEILIFEICVCDHPANHNTFTTTNGHDPRLAGIDWRMGRG